MKFRPCIDIHNGKVKQIVGGSLKDKDDFATENFVASQGSRYYASLYKERRLDGGHIILLNSKDSSYYEATKQHAIEALKEYPGGMQIGGGINDENAAFFLDAGASKVIVTSFVFKDGRIFYENLEKLVKEVGRERLVLDLSCRRKDDKYFIVTDRWQKYTEVELNHQSLNEFAGFCEEFLIHAVDVEGKARGIETGVASILGEWGRIAMTYAGGIHNMEDLEVLKDLGKQKIDFTIGSALDLFGGNLEFEKVCYYR